MDKDRKKVFDQPLSLGKASILIVIAITAVLLLVNFKTTVAVIGWIFSILSPFFIGLFIAFLMNILMTALEKRVFIFLDRFKAWRKIRRGVCIFLSFALVLGVIALLVLLIMPQIRNSLITLANNIPFYVQHWQKVITDLMIKHNIRVEDIQKLPIDWQSIANRATQLITSLTPQLATFATSFTNGVFNVLMGIFFSLYMLAGKEKILKNLKKTCTAFLGERKTAGIYEVAALTNKTFKNFIVGQLLEVLILGVMYYIACLIFGLDYPLLIAVIMAIGGLIPVFGPIIAAVPCTLILLISNPAGALIFVIIAIVIQQLEGNFIYPLIVGDSIGLPAIWVLFAILVSGSIFGMVGMFLSVPFASVLYTLLRNYVRKKTPMPLCSAECKKEKQKLPPSENTDKNE